ncbi:MAG: hypothetical protein IPM63_07145 [Acidobacteriota bacterium]|nr:MAG: hypothetical protein IPM63_07145 [Acidobacteriota bacterium]
MKSYLRVLTVGLFALLFTVAVASPAFAQECDQETKTALYQTYLDNYNSNNVADLQKAVDAAKEYIRLCGDKPEEEQLVTYFKDGYPKIEQRIIDIKEAIAAQEALDAEKKRLATFDAAYKAKNWAQVFAAGEEVLNHPEVGKQKFHLDMRILLASRGSVLAESNPPINDFNQQTLKYAQEAISRISAGETSGTGNWGAYDFSWKTKENALGQLNYAIGYIKYHPQSRKDDGIAYYYKATQFDSDTKKYSPIYVTLGEWYQEKARELGIKREALDLSEAAGEQQQPNIDKAYEYLAMEKAYVERAMDAYARALSIAKTDKGATEEFKAGLFEQLKNLFAFRYSEPTEEGKKTDASINSYVASVSSNSLPNPANEPAPVQVRPAATDKTTDGSTEGTSSDTTGGRSRTVGTTASKKAGN